MRWFWAALIAMAAAGPARADSWMLPTRTTYVSADKATRLTVVPRELESQLAYFKDKVKEREFAGQRAGETTRTARAMLERRVSGRWTKVWEAPLVNDVAPVSAIVSDDGAHVVTFDNWHGTGLGDNVVVIYRDGGRLVRMLRLDQILPAEYIKALPSSTSSLWWSGQHRFAPDGQHLPLAVVVPDEDKLPSDRHATVDIAVDLDTGAVVPPAGGAWDRALAQATRVARERDAAEAALKATSSRACLRQRRMASASGTIICGRHSIASTPSGKSALLGQWCCAPPRRATTSRPSNGCTRRSMAPMPRTS